MKTVLLTQPRCLQIVDVDRPALVRDTDVLVRITHVGICGSDLHAFETGAIGGAIIPFPQILGHECVGRVQQTGSRVVRVQAGDLVAVDPAQACLQCDQCLQGRFHTCQHLRFLGFPGEAPGCLSEWLVLPEHCLYQFPSSLSPERALLAEPLSIGLHAIRLAHLAPSESLAILGSGPIGLCVLLAAQQHDHHRIVMTDLIDQRLAAARQLGAHGTGNPNHTDIVTSLTAIIATGLDVVFECAGQQDTLDQSIALLKPGGRLVIVGIPRTDRVSFAIHQMRRKELSIINVRRQNQCLASALDVLAQASFTTEQLITHRFPLAQAQAAFDCAAHYRDGVIKAVIEMPCP